MSKKQPANSGVLRGESRGYLGYQAQIFQGAQNFANSALYKDEKL